MFPKAYRFPLRSQKRFFREAKRTRVGSLVLYWVTSNRQASRAAVIVGKSISSSSVVRNSLKRALRAAILPELQQFPKSIDVVITLQRNNKKGILEDVHNAFAMVRNLVH